MLLKVKTTFQPKPEDYAVRTHTVKTFINFLQCKGGRKASEGEMIVDLEKKIINMTEDKAFIFFFFFKEQ